jgi:hypothetical protein
MGIISSFEKRCGFSIKKLYPRSENTPPRIAMPKKLKNFLMIY